MSDTTIATEETSSWERLPDESAKAYEAFCAYRDMPGRSLLKAYRHKTGKLTAARVSGGWNAWSQEFTWTGRVEAYDAHIEQVMREARDQEYIKELESFRTRQKQMGQVCTATGVNALLLLKARLDKMVQDQEDIPISLLPGFMRSTAFMVSAGTDAEAQALGVEELLKSLSE